MASTDSTASTHSTDASVPQRDATPRSWSRRNAIAVAGIWVLAAIGLALLSVMAHANAELPGDEGLAVVIQSIHFGPLVRVINFASDANWPAPAGYTALAIILLLLIARQLSAALAAIVASFGADLANVTLNMLVARPRPHNVHIHVVANLGLHSFPSGHVTHVVSLYGFLLYLTFRVGHIHPRLKPLLWIVRAICLYFMVFIGISRVLEGEHWPSDVLGSYLLATLTLIIAIGLYHLLLHAFARLRARRTQHETHTAQSARLDPSVDSHLR